MKNFVQRGENIDAVESVLVHPSHSDNLVDSGDQVVIGGLTGVATISAGATTDVIPISTVGVYNLSVKAVNAGGNSAVAFGDKLYVDPASNAEINKKVANQPFGIALGAVGSGLTATIPVLLTGY